MQSLFALKKYFLRYKSKLAFGILFILLSNFGQVYIPLILKNTIDELQQKVTIELIIQNVLLIVGTALISGIFRFFIRQTIIVISREIEYDVRQDFWEHIQKLPLRFFQNNSTGNIMAHATNDISAVRMFVGPSVMYAIDTVTKFSIVLAIMFTISPILTGFTLVPLPFISILVYILSKKIHKKYNAIQEKFSEITTVAQENFSGIRVVKSYVREEYEIEKWKISSREYFEKNLEKVKLQAMFQPVLYLTAGLSTIIVVWIGGGMAIEGTITLGEILAFVVYLGLLIWPMIAFGWVANMVQQASASMKRIQKILNEKYEISDSGLTDYSITNIAGDIEFRNVSFRYKSDLPLVLNNISLKIPHGATAAFVGSTGVGKTSLINLIPRLYDTTSGEVLIDGLDVRNIPLNVLRENIGLVPQEAFLFSDTLENNLAYGGKKIPLEKISDISKLSKEVASFPLGFQTVLGERGITLSGGQKQRSALARALAIDPKILILDDSFSAIDTHTEEEILIKLKEFMKDRTSIIISHRISTVKDADIIFVLEDGKIAEEGKHNELVELNGIYAELHNKQLLEEELKELN
ncbi:MAG: ABC transporter ATP-binding protein [Ignavibacteriaceae bacterium]|jgi:ATP-binding cassette subfamily B protein|nr:ABC transporter ATP-binding protein [Ignavibacteriaceae bacterium]